MAKSPASELGAKMKESRSKAREELNKLRGKDLAKLNNNEQIALLVALCQLLGLVDKDNRLR